MPWTANVWTWIANSFNPAVTGTPISSSDWNASVADLQTSLSDVPRFVTAQAAAYLYGGVAGGTANALTLTLSPAITAYNNGLTVRGVTGTSANTGDSTLTVNGLAATQILLNGLQLDAGDLPANTEVEFTYYNSKWWYRPAPQPIASQLLTGFTNLLDNGDGLIAQDGVLGGVADNGHGIDRWRVLSNGSTVTMQSSTASLPNGANARGAVSTDGANVKFGCISIVAANRVRRLRNRTVTLSASLSVSDARLGNMKIGIMEWTSTADGTTADPISAWNADGTTPTLAANWAFLNTPANLSTGTSFTAITPITVTVGGSANNLAVFIWNDDTTVNAGDTYAFVNVQLNEGRVALPYEIRPFSLALQMCRAFYRKSFAYGSAPATNFGLTGSVRWRALGTGAVATEAPMIFFEPPMNATPTVTIYNPSAANNQIRNVTDGADFSASSGANITADSFVITGTGNAGQAVNEQLAAHYMADARL